MRDPLYRCESAQQARRGVPGWVFVLLLAVVPWAAGLVLSDAVTRSIDDGSLEGVLLTPVDRRRLVWAKLLGGLRQMLLTLLILPGLGLLADAIMLISGWPLTEFLLPFSVWGLLAGPLLAGQYLTSGAIGVYVGLRWPGWFRTSALGILAVGILIHIEVAAAYALVVVLYLVRLPLTHEFPLVEFICIYPLLRIVVVNLLLPWWLMNSAALRLDDWLAGKGGRRPSRAERLARLAGG